MEGQITEAEFPFRVVYATQSFLGERGFARVAGLRYIFDHRPAYHRLANRFLIDLGLGEWNLSTRQKISLAVPPTKATLHNYACWLANYLEYCHARGRASPIDCDYQVDLVSTYQREMSLGTWSRDNAPLAPKTINSRISIACMLQLWAVDKGLRESFHIPKVRKFIAIGAEQSAGASVARMVESRRGKVKESKRRIGFPNESLIGDWLHRLYAKSQTEGLIAELILETAVRRAEAAAWRVDTLPLEPDDWQVANPDRPIEHQAVIVMLRYATKGPSYGEDHGDKVGPEGKILVPMPMALKLHQYRRTERAKALTVALRKTKSSREAVDVQKNTVHC